MARNGPRIACNASPPRWTIDSTCRRRKSLLRKIWPVCGAGRFGVRNGPGTGAANAVRENLENDTGSLKSILRALAISWARFRRSWHRFHCFGAFVQPWGIYGPLWPIGVGAKKDAPGLMGRPSRGVNPGFWGPVRGVRPRPICGSCGVRRHPSRAYRWHPEHRWKARGQDLS